MTYQCFATYFTLDLFLYSWYLLHLWISEMHNNRSKGCEYFSDKYSSVK